MGICGAKEDSDGTTQKPATPKASASPASVAPDLNQTSVRTGTPAKQPEVKEPQPQQVASSSSAARARHESAAARLGAKQFKTFKPLKTHAPQRYRLAKQAQLTLGTGNLRHAVKLPANEDLNEWLAVNTVDFFNDINMLFGSISSHCKKVTCPQMAAGDAFHYLWADGDKYPQPVAVSAPVYIDLLMTWVEKQLNDESKFPLQEHSKFPPDFLQMVKVIFKRLFRVYAHIYYSHMEPVEAHEEQAHLNTSLKHFYYFVNEFELVESKELEPLKDVISALTARDEQ